MLYEFTPDRKGEHLQRRLRDFRSILQADAYAGFNALYETGRVVEAACWTHARRHFHDELLANGSPLAREAIERMHPLFAIEAESHGQPPEARLAARQARSAPVMADLHAWLEGTLQRISGKSDPPYEVLTDRMYGKGLLPRGAETPLPSHGGRPGRGSSRRQATLPALKRCT